MNAPIPSSREGAIALLALITAAPGQQGHGLETPPGPAPTTCAPT